MIRLNNAKVMNKVARKNNLRTQRRIGKSIDEQIKSFLDVDLPMIKDNIVDESRKGNYRTYFYPKQNGVSSNVVGLYLKRLAAHLEKYNYKVKVHDGYLDISW